MSSRNLSLKSLWTLGWRSLSSSVGPVVVRTVVICGIHGRAAGGPQGRIHSRGRDLQGCFCIPCTLPFLYVWRVALLWLFRRGPFPWRPWALCKWVDVLAQPPQIPKVKSTVTHDPPCSNPLRG